MRPEKPKIRLRAARLNDILRLNEIELAADRLFEGTGLLDQSPADSAIPVSAFEQAISEDLCHVAVDAHDAPVGFTFCTDRRPDLYLDQVSVDPGFARLGIGRRLVNHVADIAADRRFACVSLSTFRDVAWNGPFYQSLGFMPLEANELTDWMSELEAYQSAYLDITQRCFMRRPVKPRPLQRIRERFLRSRSNKVSIKS